MKIKVFMVLFLVVLVTLLPVACTALEETTTPATTTPVTARPAIEPPTEEQLRQANFSHPEIPRITSEQLKLIMDGGDVFVLVDARDESDWDAGHLPEALNIPNVLDTAVMQNARDKSLGMLPKDRLIIFYGNSADDADAADLAQQLIDLNAGHDLENIRVLWQGYPRWKELRYPTRETDYPSGGGV